MSIERLDDENCEGVVHANYRIDNDNWVEFVDGRDTIIKIAEPQSKLKIGPDLELHSSYPMPGRWHRFWQRVLLGWQWEKYE